MEYVTNFNTTKCEKLAMQDIINDAYVAVYENTYVDMLPSGVDNKRKLKFPFCIITS